MRAKHINVGEVVTVLGFLSKLLAIVANIDSASVAFLSSVELATMVFSITRNRGYLPMADGELQVNGPLRVQRRPQSH